LVLKRGELVQKDIQTGCHTITTQYSGLSSVLESQDRQSRHLTGSVELTCRLFKVK